MIKFLHMSSVGNKGSLFQIVLSCDCGRTTHQFDVYMGIAVLLHGFLIATKLILSGFLFLYTY